ncbi:MAG TPA: hypothetical protein ENG31_00435 [Candidatus Thorarchaeota archaeon]|nr:MAG: hypothetical protein DRO73_05145 [Candidatus Thorarchaeota archaeon]HDD67073.1 hypothetical protein [Candidatus Thorarchaeota archaeon]
MMREYTLRAPSLRTRVFALVLLVSVMVVVTIAPPVRAETTDTMDPTITVTIVDATYTDIDSDAYEDDVLVILRFDLGYHLYYEFGYLITLQLPSGENYTYLVYVLAWVDTVYTYNMFYNHATESGDYTVHVQALLLTPGTATDTAHYTFDPPGGSEGGEPTFGVC